MQETTAFRSRTVGLIFAFMMVFPNFLARIPISSEMLLTNRKNLIVDEVAFFKKVSAFWKLMARIGNILGVKVIHRIAIVGNFPAFWLVFIVFPAFG